jgi:hypothetical protein
VVPDAVLLHAPVVVVRIGGPARRAVTAAAERTAAGRDAARELIDDLEQECLTLGVDLDALEALAQAHRFLTRGGGAGARPGKDDNMRNDDVTG